MPRRFSSSLHPAERFAAATSIQAGVPLKHVFDRPMVALIAESLSAVSPNFESKKFLRDAVRGIEELEFKDRGRHIANAMQRLLPGDFRELQPLLIQSFGPELKATDGNGLAPFFYFPHACLIETLGLEHFDLGMQANYELTKRFTAEFSIRPYLITHQAKALKLLLRWTRDKSPHVRRLVSEGSRPRLPWAGRLPELQKNPLLALPLLEKLKDDPELYVRRSVANHLGDILKDHPNIAFETCERWIDELSGKNTANERVQNRFWLIRHAVRLPAKKNDKQALEIRKRAARGS